jgi:hypothetical protein
MLQEHRRQFDTFAENTLKQKLCITLASKMEIALQFLLQFPSSIPMVECETDHQPSHRSVGLLRG